MVRVRYRVVVEHRLDGVVAYGTLNGNPEGLRPIWLQPDALLRLGRGQRLDISVTDLVGAEATFESTGGVPDFNRKSQRSRKLSHEPGTGERS